MKELYKKGKYMGKMQVGFSRKNITPYLGVPIPGYYCDRLTEGVLDDLYANVLAVTDGQKTALLFSLDTISIEKAYMDVLRNAVSQRTGVPYEAILIACTHTHTSAGIGARGEKEGHYNEYVKHRLCDAAQEALLDCKPAAFSYAKSRAPHISFIRRFRMKDGTIETNPGIDNPNIQEPIGVPDESVQVVRIQREGGEEIALINFQTHADTIGGCNISADFPGFLRSTFEAVMPNAKCMFFNGAQGDTNHVNVHPGPGDLNGLNTDSFDDVARGHEHAKYMGQVVAGAVLQVYLKAAPLKDGAVGFLQKTIEIPSQMPAKEQIPEAERIVSLHNAGRDEELGYRGMMLTTVVGEALRMVKLKDGPESFGISLSAIVFGEVAFVGFPGEPFTETGVYLKEHSPYAVTFPCCLTNGNEDYFPVRSAYDEGGYEARSSNFCPGVAEILTENALDMLRSLKDEAKEQ